MAPQTMATRERGTGTPLVLLHAFPLSASLFDALGDLSGYRLILPDLRGFGATPLGTDEPSLSHMAEDVVALLDRLGLDTAVVGGVSMGGYVTMELMRQAPERLAGVLLIDTKGEADPAAARDGRLAMADAVLAKGPGVLDPMLDLLLGDTSRASRPDVVQRVRGWLDVAPPEAVAWAQRAMAKRPDSLATLAESGIAGAVVVGDEDLLSPVDNAEQLARALGTSPVVVPGTGHLAVTEAPQAARAAMLSALRPLAAPA